MYILTKLNEYNCFVLNEIRERSLFMPIGGGGLEEIKGGSEIFLV